ncbi:hypothetical protein QJS04_geneDACA003685 [Acorus gramineus]|uniref:Uncharacterized protein n=1 Tax=Acorus gramineus TaxID=55184 RepID=A0AAV9BPK7_ACOGR|nr:hypothetical protein QJS04_geneDACA003685 [Acorus gramineus]
MLCVPPTDPRACARYSALYKCSKIHQHSRESRTMDVGAGSKVKGYAGASSFP